MSLKYTKLLILKRHRHNFFFKCIIKFKEIHACKNNFIQLSSALTVQYYANLNSRLSRGVMENLSYEQACLKGLFSLEFEVVCGVIKCRKSLPKCSRLLLNKQRPRYRKKVI